MPRHTTLGCQIIGLWLVVYKVGHLNQVADALLRWDEKEGAIYAILHPRVLFLDAIRDEVVASNTLQELCAKIQNGLDDF